MFQSLGNLGSHPFVENLREQVQNFRDAQQQQGTTRPRNNDATSDEPEDEESFSPPIDIFNTPSAYVLHAALPGAKKEDVGVNWDPDTSTLSIAGVVYRPGDESFLQTLTPSSERRVGAFERTVTLPPAGCEKDGEVDGLSITARMEDGLLVVTVPKVEKEWTEIRKVDIE
jgi:HSP20 family protein